MRITEGIVEEAQVQEEVEIEIETPHFNGNPQMYVGGNSVRD